MNPGHQPERFQVYEELPDGSGFTIKGSSHLFLFDRGGGWSDEYGNYYNARGEPDDPLSSSQSYSHSDGYSRGSADSDEFEREFGAPRDLSDEEGELKEEEAARLARNAFNLQAYPAQQCLRVYFHNLPFKSRKQEVLKAYSAQVENSIRNVILDIDQEGKNVGTGYFIATPEVAVRLIRLEGHRLLERPLHFEIQDYESFLIFPLTPQELQDNRGERAKKFVLKNPVKEEECEKVEGVWSWYKFEKNTFPKKSQFRNWMIENGFNPEEDFKNIEKMENEAEKNYVKVEMKESTFKSINGVSFGEKAVEFIPL